VPVWNQDFENILADEAMDQYIRACTFEGKFEWNRTITILVILLVLSLLPLGILLNSVFHIIPNTNIHWIR
jgi:flagellar biosynthesis protein FliP